MLVQKPDRITVLAEAVNALRNDVNRLQSQVDAITKWAPEIHESMQAFHELRAKIASLPPIPEGGKIPTGSR